MKSYNAIQSILQYSYKNSDVEDRLWLVWIQIKLFIIKSLICIKMRVKVRTLANMKANLVQCKMIERIFIIGVCKQVGPIHTYNLSKREKIYNDSHRSSSIVGLINHYHSNKYLTHLYHKWSLQRDITSLYIFDI